MLGLLAINKLIPVKYMGNLVLEFYLAQNEECLWSTSSATITRGAYAAGGAASVGASAVTVGSFGCTLNEAFPPDVHVCIERLTIISHVSPLPQLKQLVV
jgi:hypothetical protein